MERKELEELVKKAFPEAPYLFNENLADEREFEVEVYVDFKERVLINHHQKNDSFRCVLNDKHRFFSEVELYDEELLIKVLRHRWSFTS